MRSPAPLLLSLVLSACGAPASPAGPALDLREAARDGGAPADLRPADQRPAPDMLLAPDLEPGEPACLPVGDRTCGTSRVLTPCCGSQGNARCGAVSDPATDQPDGAYLACCLPPLAACSRNEDCCAGQTVPEMAGQLGDWRPSLCSAGKCVLGSFAVTSDPHNCAGWGVNNWHGTGLIVCN